MFLHRWPIHPLVKVTQPMHANAASRTPGYRNVCVSSSGPEISI